MTAMKSDVDYTYDGDGKRTSIIDTTAGGVVTTTVFTCQGGAIVGETVNGTPSRSYLAAGSSMAEMTIPSGSGAGTYVVSWNGHGDATGLSLTNADGSALWLASRAGTGELTQIRVKDPLALTFAGCASETGSLQAAAALCGT